MSGAQNYYVDRVWTHHIDRVWAHHIDRVWTHHKVPIQLTAERQEASHNAIKIYHKHDFCDVLAVSLLPDGVTNMQCIVTAHSYSEHVTTVKY